MKGWPSLGFDANAWKDFVLDTEDEFAASKRPLSTGENFDNDISFTVNDSIGVDDGSNEDSEKTIATKLEIPYAEGGEEYVGDLVYNPESEQEYGSFERDDKYHNEDGMSFKSNSVGNDNGDFASVDNSSKSSSDDDSDDFLNVQPSTKKQRHGILSANTQETHTDTTTFDTPKGRSLYCLNLNCRVPPGRLLQPDLTGWWWDV